MFDSIGAFFSALGGGFQLILQRVGLMNSPALKDNAVAKRDEATKNQVDADLQSKDDTKIVQDLDPGA